MTDMRDANDLNESALGRALGSEGLRSLAVNVCGAANGLTLSAFLMLWLALVVGPYVPSIRPDTEAAAASLATALGIGIASVCIVFVPRSWRWIALLAVSTVQFLAAAISIPSLF